MLHGPWKDATSPVLTLHVDDNNVNREAIAIALAYLYGNHPKLDDSNAFRVLAAASFLDLQVSLHVNYSVSTGPSVGSMSFGECITELYIIFFLNWLPTGFCSMFDLNVTFLAGFMCNLHRFHYI